MGPHTARLRYVASIGIPSRRSQLQLIKRAARLSPASLGNVSFDDILWSCQESWRPMQYCTNQMRSKRQRNDQRDYGSIQEWSGDSVWYWTTLTDCEQIQCSVIAVDAIGVQQENGQSPGKIAFSRLDKERGTNELLHDARGEERKDRHPNEKSDRKQAHMVCHLTRETSSMPNYGNNGINWFRVNIVKNLEIPK